jgi:hypothetical protein
MIILKTRVIVYIDFFSQAAPLRCPSPKGRPVSTATGYQDTCP